MRDNVDYRLLERFRALERLKRLPSAAQPEQKRAAAGAERRRPPAIDLRD